MRERWAVVGALWCSPQPGLAIDQSGLGGRSWWSWLLHNDYRGLASSLSGGFCRLSLCLAQLCAVGLLLLPALAGCLVLGFLTGLLLWG